MQRTNHKPRRFYLLTHPRSASNMLIRILNLENQPNAAFHKHGGYFFHPAFSACLAHKTHAKNIKDTTPTERDEVMKAYQDCYNDFEDFAQTAAANGQICLVKEHVVFSLDPVAMTKFFHGHASTNEPPWTVQVPATYAARTHSPLNVTIMPDEVLSEWSPTFLIRHPALAFPSLYRTSVDNEGQDEAQKQAEGMHVIPMTLHWTRSLYDWYAERSQPPLVLDADDLMTGRDVIIRFCEIVGMDTDKLRFSWAPHVDEEMPPNIQRMVSTLSASSGVLAGKTSDGLDIDKEAQSWRVEFGQRVGDLIEQRVRAAMPDYEFLKARRLQAHSSKTDTLSSMLAKGVTRGADL